MKNFEKEARKQLDQHKSSIEVKPVWEKINLELRPQRNKSGIFWWPLGISLLGLSLFILLNPSIDKTKSNSILSNLYSNETTKSTNDVKESINNTNSSKDLKKLESEKIANNIESNECITKSINNKTQVPSIKENLNTNKINIIENKTKSHNTSSAILFNSISPQTNASLFNQDVVNTEKETPQNKTDNLITVSKAEDTNLAVLDFRIFPILSNNKIESIKSIKPLYQNYKLDKFSLYMSIYGGYGYPIRLLAAKDSNNKYYQDSRSSTETTLDVLQFGLLIGTKTYSGLFVESGFEFNRINERFDWNKTVTDSLKKYLSTGFYVNSASDTTFLYDSIDVIKRSTYSKKIYNNYSFYSIPIIVGYEFNKMARTRFYAKIGILVNLKLNNKVTMLDETGLPIDFENGPNPLFKSKIGFTPFISAGVKYSFNNTVELFGELNYKNLNDISESSYILKQSYNLLSANVGLQFNF